MDKTIFIKYGELCLKGNNIKDFKLQLNSNLQYALRNFKVKIDFFYDYILVNLKKEDDENELVKIIKFIPGFSFLSIAYKVNKNIDQLKQSIVNILPSDFFSFKVECKRQDKNFDMTSEDIKKNIGAYILSVKDCKVDVHNPQIKVYIELKNDYFLFFTNKIKTSNGLPIGMSGRLLVLLSGGIDSPVASRLVMNRGFKIDFLTFITPPHTPEKLIDKINALVNKITIDNHLQDESKLYVCNYTPILNELAHISKQNYKITLLRRSFFRIASLLVDKYGYDGIVTGESLGQVASQTIESIQCISDSSDKVIIRPLITYDKEQIIQLAKSIDTYETSIIPLSDSCSLFAPKNPVTKPKVDICRKLESEINLIFDLEQNIISKIETNVFKK